MRTFDCERLETTYFMQKSKKLRKVTCKNRKSCKKLQYKILGNSSKHWNIYVL